MSSRSLRVAGTVFRRELATVARTQAYVVLATGLFAAALGVVTVGGGADAGFVPAVVDLLLPIELLVPLAAVLLGYRALYADLASGEFAVIRTYPVGATAYVAGVLFARITAFFLLVGVPLTLIGGIVWATASPDTGIYATHRGIDSPIVYVRFLALALALGVPYLTLAAAGSALAASRRGALAIAAAVLVVGVVGGDLVLLRGLGSGAVAPGGLATALAGTPNGAFRGLAFEHVVGIAFAPDGGFVDSYVAVASLVAWSLAGLLAAVGVLTGRRRVDLIGERVRRRLP